MTDFAQRALALESTMYRVACGMLRTEADRQDAMQQALLRAWEKRHTLRDPQLFDAWMIRILVNECKSIYRRQARVTPVAQLPETPVQGPDIDVADALSRLPWKQRICVTLHYLEGLPTDAIAVLLRIPGSTVRSRLARARQLLRLELEEGDIA